MTDTPLPFIWRGDSFTPANASAQKQCDKLYTIGERYLMAPVFERSSASHRYFFASVREAWKNLRHEDEERYPSEAHLRKRALIACGFYDRDEFLASSKTEAMRIAAFVRSVDDYAVVIVRDKVVERLTAKSMSNRSMNKAEFMKASEAVLAYLAQMIGTTPATLSANAQRAA